MEKILRKVSCKDRFPTKKDYYYTLLFNDADYQDRAVREYLPDYNNWWKNNVEYWYEEVDLSNIIDKAYNLGFSTAKKILEEIQINELKERYEKALILLMETAIIINQENPMDKTIIKALKIIAGKKKDKI